VTGRLENVRMKEEYLSGLSERFFTLLNQWLVEVPCLYILSAVLDGGSFEPYVLLVRARIGRARRRWGGIGGQVESHFEIIGNVASVDDIDSVESMGICTRDCGIDVVMLATGRSVEGNSVPGRVVTTYGHAIHAFRSFCSVPSNGRCTQYPCSHIAEKAGHETLGTFADPCNGESDVYSSSQGVLSLPV
jgi:hypothetical protein